MPDTTNNINAPTVIDLFAGCGGLSLGLHNAGWKGLFAIEKSEDAFATLKHNLIDNENNKHFDWPNWLEQKNWEIKEFIQKYQTQLLNLRGSVDLVAGGPPCQGFSMAGRRKESDIRNQLVHSYIDFISLVRPKIIFFENVKGFTLGFKKNKEKGIAYSEVVQKKLFDLGYRVNGKLVNFGMYGVPQKRTRFILIGVNTEYFENAQKIANNFFTQLEEQRYNFLEGLGITAETNLKQAISDLLKNNGVIKHNDFKRFDFGRYRNRGLSNYQRLMRKGISSKTNQPDSHRFANHYPEIIQKMSSLITLSHERKGKDIGSELKQKYHIKKHTVIVLSGDEKAPTITTLPDDYIHYCEPRILTVREYARIQSFPDMYIFKGKYTTGGKLRTKETPRYTQIGNAIPPLFGMQAGIILSKVIHHEQTRI
jgi:DNA (cytosine-5)-methyltransferase 1